MEAAGSSETLAFICKTTRTQASSHVTTATELPTRLYQDEDKKYYYLQRFIYVIIFI